MKNKIIGCLLSVAFLFIVSCKTDPVPIEYGKDECALCRMSIVERGYGAELISAKGKIFKFDSGECLVNYIRINLPDTASLQAVLVTDRSIPGQLIDANSAFYLVSDKLPSPMGANLSAFAVKDSLSEFLGRFGGEIYSWSRVFEKIR